MGTPISEPTSFDDHVQLDAAVHDWLQETIKPGDLVLIGGATTMSRFIQRRLRSDFTHVALVTTDQTIAESYSYRLNMNETADGVTETDLDDFCRRHTKVSTLSVLRPDGLDVKAVVDQIRLHAERHIPYPSAGMVVLAVAVITSRLANRQRAGSLRGRILKGLVAHQVKLAGDGRSHMHCAEYVTRMYLAAGLALRFDNLTLGYDTNHLRDHSSQRLEPAIEPNRSSRRPPPTSALATIARSLPLACYDLCRSLTSRHRAATPADLADIVFPPDLAKASPLVEVGRLDVDQQTLTIRSPSGPLLWSDKRFDYESY